MSKESASAWLSDLSRKTMAPMGRWEMAGLSGEVLVLEGAGALSAGQIAPGSAVAVENERLEAQGKPGASYYELGMERGGSMAGLAVPGALEVIKALEGRLRGSPPPGLSLGQLLSLESGLKKLDRQAPDEVTPEELRVVARSPAAMSKARDAGVPEAKLKKAQKEDRQRRAALIESASEQARLRSEQRKAAPEGAEAEEGVKGPGAWMRGALERWRETAESAERMEATAEGEAQGPDLEKGEAAPKTKKELKR